MDDDMRSTKRGHGAAGPWPRGLIAGVEAVQTGLRCAYRNLIRKFFISSLVFTKAKGSAC